MPLVEEVVPEAEALGDPGLLARVHRALSMLYGWTGTGSRAREHADRALAFARASKDEGVIWSVEWALAVLDGLHGNSEGVRNHRQEAERLATALRSPLLQAATAEIAIEYASGVGDWGEALALADQAIPIARAIAPRTLLPRILVWTGIVYLARAEMDRARALLDEAWHLSGADRDGAFPPGAAHNIILAHTGRAAWHLAKGEWTRALHVGGRGLALADQYGYVVWAIHRLLPQIAEASLWLQDFERAQYVATRLREGSEALGHRLGMAWASAVEALIARFRDGRSDAWREMLQAARELDSIPFVFHAARLRRNAAQLMETDGLTDEAVRVLREAHDVFLRLGAEHELRGTRSQLRSLGVRLPPRQVMEGAGALTGRELEIARRVSRRLSNKEIARELDISARTVSTHLSNIFQKLGVDSRGALADLVRAHPLLGPQDD
jgi:DNA-binding CsgD family transcriptional regulator